MIDLHVSLLIAVAGRSTCVNEIRLSLYFGSRPCRNRPADTERLDVSSCLSRQFPSGVGDFPLSVRTPVLKTLHQAKFEAQRLRHSAIGLCRKDSLLSCAIAFHHSTKSTSVSGMDSLSLPLSQAERP